MTEPAPMTQQPPAGDARPASRLARLAGRPPFIALLLAAATLAVLLPVTRNDFVSYDDPEYVTANPHVQRGLTLDGTAWAFQTGHAQNWHPVTWISHMLDCQLYGPKPAGHHLTNLLLHVLNTVLLFILLQRLTGALGRSAFVAALFALHPLHVESVAWIAERKDLLSAFFFMLTLLAYARYAKSRQMAGGRPETDDSDTRTTHHASRITDHASRITHHVALFYLLSLFFFALGLMSKPMLVTLPFVLLLLDYWPLQRLRLSTLTHLALEKWPFLVLSAASCLVTILAQRGAMQPLANFSLGARLSNALVAYAGYLGKTFWPVNLAAPYPYPAHWPVTEILLAAALVAGLTFAAAGLSRRFPFAATGWFWFLGMLVPVIGLVQVGEQSMADRYTYLPSIGLFILLTWGAGAAFARWRVPKVVCGIAAGVALLPCAWQTRNQVAYWQNSEKLFYHAVAVTKDNWLAWFNLGWNYDNQGRVDDALASYRKAVQIQPNYVAALVNIGAVLASRKQFPDAIPYFERAVRADPASVDCHDNLGHALMEVGRFEAAIPHLRLVARQRPKDVVALNSLGDALARTGQFAQAIPCLETSLLAKPDQAAVHYSLAQALAKLRRTEQAILHFREAIRCQPKDPEALNSLAWIRAANSDPAFRNGDEALRLAQRACELTRYQRPVMLGTLAAAYAEAGRFEEAIATAQKAHALAVSSGQKELAAKDQQMLEIYQTRQAYHEPPEPPLAPPPDK